MKNLTGEPVKVGAVTVRAATGFYWGETTYHGGMQRMIARDRWEPMTDCGAASRRGAGHRHGDAESALACGQEMVDALAVLR